MLMLGQAGTEEMSDSADYTPRSPSPCAQPGKKRLREEQKAAVLSPGAS